MPYSFRHSDGRLPKATRNQREKALPLEKPSRSAASAIPTPSCDRMKAVGQWNVACDRFFDLDPHWTDGFMATGVGIYGSRVFTAREIELLSVAFDASFTSMYAPGTRRHVRGALAEGATVEEIMEVLKLCVARGVQACNLGVPILDEDLARAERGEVGR